jgi:hypothetical protein
MKIDVLNLYPSMCGPTTVCAAQAAGLRALGHESRVVTPTKSGKDHKTWTHPDALKYGVGASHKAPDLVIRYDDVVDHIRSLDGVILSEPRNTKLDNEAKRAFEMPPYFGWLALTKDVPWATIMPCPQFHASAAPFLERLCDMAPPAGIVAAFPSFVPQSVRERAPNCRILFDNKLPYVRRGGDDLPMRPAVGVFGRLQANKGGWTSLLAILEWLPKDLPIDIWGACPKGLAASVSIRMIEALRTEYGEDEFWWLRPDQMGGNDWRPLYADPFRMRTKTGHVIQYLGGYTDAVKAMSQYKVVVNLTDYNFSRGTLENVGLEALDAGCDLITNPHSVCGDKCYDVSVVRDHFYNARMNAKGFEIDATPARQLQTQLISALEEEEERCVERAARNRLALREAHSPKRHAALLMRALDLVPPVVEVASTRARLVTDLIERDWANERDWSPNQKVTL